MKIVPIQQGLDETVSAVGISTTSVGIFWPLGCGFESLMGQAWVKVVCAASDDPKMVKTLFAPMELAMSVYWVVSEDVIELLIYHQPSVKPSLTLRPFGILGYVAGHSLTGGC